MQVIAREIEIEVHRLEVEKRVISQKIEAKNIDYTCR